MTLLLPIGLLGLLSLIILLIIYIIKPNYQQKEVTSTYVWRLSLKLRKKRLPTSKLRNILLIICQVCTLVAGAFILAQPIMPHEQTKYSGEAVIIIDASASMRTYSEGATRFEKAIDYAKECTDKILSKGGEVSVIISDATPHFIANRVGIVDRDELFYQLDDMASDIDNSCSYGVTDLNQAISMCEDTVRRNPTTTIFLCTDSDYGYVADGVELVNVAKSSEFNVAILDAYTIFEEGYYSFVVKLGCYGQIAQQVDLSVTINGANDGKQTLSTPVEYGGKYNINENSEYTIIFRNDKIEESDYEKDAKNLYIEKVGSSVTGNRNLTCVVSYTDVHIEIDVDDNFDEDNSLAIYGGTKNQLKVQYATNKRKVFITGLFGVLRNQYSNRWDLRVKEVLLPEEQPASSGYDLNIFENYLPESLPTDGVVYLLNPPKMPDGLTAANTVTCPEMYLLQETNHDILKYTDSSKIFVRKYTKLATCDESLYKILWSVDSSPVLLVRESEDAQIVVSLFDIEYSNFVLRSDFVYFFDNIFDYFIPSTVIGNIFEVGKAITVNARGNTLTVTNNSDYEEQVITQLPSSISLNKPGTYKFSQSEYMGRTLPDEYVYVKVPASESNVFAIGNDMKELYREKIDEDNFDDLLVYIAAIMLFLMFAEWFLQAHDNA